MKKILVFDNYDSFTYNLVHAVKELGYEDLTVVRNDAIALEDVEKYDKILLSPGPGIPNESGLLLPLIDRYAPFKSILGVCLGQQAIAESFGAKLMNLKEVKHGIATPVRQLVENPLFKGLPEEFEVGRYHSWVVDKEGLPDCLEILAEDYAGEIMALRHKTLDVYGVQFHPESVLTPQGMQILSNWLTM